MRFISLSLLAAAAALPGCAVSVDYTGKTCSAPGDCPSGYVCGTGGTCQKEAAGDPDGSVNPSDGGSGAPDAGAADGGGCLDTKNDPNNCGSCGTVCNAPQGGLPACSGGRCVGSCFNSGEQVCGAGLGGGGYCANLNTAPSNCGSCGHSCGSDSCVGGQCVPGCTGAGLRLCGTPATCVDVTTDPSNCGLCGIACQPPTGGIGTQCSNGACVGQCVQGQALCGADAASKGGGYCADFLTDLQNCGSCGNPCTGSGASCVAGTCNIPSMKIWMPEAPNPNNFAWQGRQTRFRSTTGQGCTSLVAMAMGPTAFCYASQGGQLMCAGRIYQTNFGSSFKAVANITGVDQILIGPSSICVHTTVNGVGQAQCLGANGNGQFGSGTTNSTTQWSYWGSGLAIDALAVGSWGTLCGRQPNSVVSCSGVNYGLTPTVAFTSATSVWLSGNNPKFNDQMVVRASGGNADCQVTNSGSLLCRDGNYRGNSVVDGGWRQMPNLLGIPEACWLESSGLLMCDQTTNPLNFGSQVLAIALEPNSDSLCAAWNDGSITCIGDNTDFKLGVGSSTPLTSEQMVAPRGSISTTCH